MASTGSECPRAGLVQHMLLLLHAWGISFWIAALQHDCQWLCWPCLLLESLCSYVCSCVCKDFPCDVSVCVCLFACLCASACTGPSACVGRCMLEHRCPGGRDHLTARSAVPIMSLLTVCVLQAGWLAAALCTLVSGLLRLL